LLPEPWLTPVTEHEFLVVRELAESIWRQHYTGIVSREQIDSMLAGRFSDGALREQLQARDKWFALLRVSGTPVGYCGYELSREDPDTLKLVQLYVLESHRGKGLGRFMLGYVENRTRELGRHTFTLQVNKRNAGAIEFYSAAGFEVVKEAVFGIGGGFVMDDYVMRKLRWREEPLGIRRL
jgi:ribosomal protein S18 acetylase RimI-like enzyme